MAWQQGIGGSSRTRIDMVRGANDAASARRFHRGFTAAEKTKLWDRWKRGESLKAIGRAFGCDVSNKVKMVLHSWWPKSRSVGEADASIGAPLPRPMRRRHLCMHMSFTSEDIWTTGYSCRDWSSWSRSGILASSREWPGCRSCGPYHRRA